MNSLSLQKGPFRADRVENENKLLIRYFPYFGCIQNIFPTKYKTNKKNL